MRKIIFSLCTLVLLSCGSNDSNKQADPSSGNTESATTPALDTSSISTAPISTATDTAGKPIAGVLYVCPPCPGCNMHDTTFTKPGPCPACGMALVEKK